MDSSFPTLNRREALAAAGVATAGAALGFHGLLAPGDAGAAGSCLLQREVTEGPYYLDLDLVRRDITGNRKGTPLTLRFQVVDATACEPIEGAAVEIWHADASGAYSGVQGDSGTWLRGIQRSGANGWVRFDTIFPGWYPGRTPHIHMKVFVSGDEVHTGQVFFYAATKRVVYAQGRYAARGQASTSNASDSIYREAGARALMPLRRKGARIGRGMRGRLVVGVDA